MSESAPAEWYADPMGRYEQRYWDGARWTEHVATAGRVDVDPLAVTQSPSSSDPQVPDGWYPDPYGRYETRYWDGAVWTSHVASQGRQGMDDPRAGVPVGQAVSSDSRIQAQVRRAGVIDSRGADQAALLTEQVLVVNQKARFFGSNSEYHVFDQHGRPIGAFREVDGRVLAKATMGQRAPQRFHVVDPQGRTVISLYRPTRLWKSRMMLVGPHGTSAQIVQQSTGLFGRPRFSLESDGRVLGSIQAENSHAWDFTITDESDAEIARITKTWAGWAKERFTKADNYVVQIHRQLEDPLRSLVVAAALAVDTALKEGRPTSGTGSTRRYK